MAFSECENGHIYDSAQYSSCPYCNNKEVRIEFSKSTDDIGKTVPVTSCESIGKTVPVTSGESIGKTVPVTSGEGIGKTVPVMNDENSEKEKPVFGWLVIIDGPESGKDYRIDSGNCLVGTSKSCDIVIPALKRDDFENWFRICYDFRGGVFYIVPNADFTDIYIENEPVFSQRKITSHTVIEVGGIKLSFVPFCNEEISWNQ